MTISVIKCTFLLHFSLHHTQKRQTCSVKKCKNCSDPPAIGAYFRAYIFCPKIFKNFMTSINSNAQVIEYLLTI